MTKIHPSPPLEPDSLDSEQDDEQALFEALRRVTLGEYDIYSQLGSGGMASVYLALELSLNRRVAIKVIAPTALASKSGVDRFWLEARTAASLSHPHVIPIYSVKSLGGLHFFVMKHIEGGSLDVVLKMEGTLGIPLARTILSQVGGALAYAHKRGVIHRDIKPANIMLDDDGFAVVMDFGIAKVRDAATLTASGAMVGTPLYMSPEQFSGDMVDGRSDQYSLGVVAFELLTGRRPFKGETVPEALRGTLMENPPDIREFRPDCPAFLAAIVDRALRKAPAERFPSMDAFCAQLSSMPRVDADEVRDSISSLAKTASLSNPKISQPVSPVPLSRTSAERILQSSEPAPSSGVTPAITSRLLTVGTKVRKRPWVSGAIAASLIGIVAFAVSANTGITQRSTVGIAPPGGTLDLTPSETRTESRDTALPSTIPLASGTSESSASDVLRPADASKAPATSVRTAQDSKKTSDARAARVQPSATDLRSLSTEQHQPAVADEPPPTAKEPEPEIVVPPPAPVVTPPRPRTAFRIGSRTPLAFLYIDGQFNGRIGSPVLHNYPPGVVRLQIRAEDCQPWDTVLILREGETTVIGYRNPKCSR